MSSDATRVTVSENSDVQLMIAAAQGGSTQAVGQLADVYRNYLLVISRAGLSRDLQAKIGASDVVQETFLDVQRDISSFRGSSETEFMGWLRQILSHKLAAICRPFTTTGKRQIHDEISMNSDEPMGLSRCRALVDSQTPSRNALASEESAILHEALDRLPEHYRQVIVLRNFELWPFEQIGEALGRSSDAARKLWSRAADQLQAELTKPDYCDRHSAPRDDCHESSGLSKHARRQDRSRSS